MLNGCWVKLNHKIKEGQLLKTAQVELWPLHTTLSSLFILWSFV